MSYFSKTVSGYSGTWDSHYSHTFTGGAFLCSIPTAQINGIDASGGQNGVFLAYRQQKSWSVVDDSASVVYVGRKYPVAEFGLFEFATGQFSFALPVPGLLYSTGVATNPFDTTLWTNTPGGTSNGTSAEGALRSIVDAQHSGALCYVLDARGRQYYGSLYNLKIDDQEDGWAVASIEFNQVGIPQVN